MENKNELSNEELSEDRIKSSKDLLVDIDEAAKKNVLKTTDLSDSWRILRRSADPHGDEKCFEALKTEFENDKRNWIENLYKKWIDPGLKDQSEFARLGAIRLLATVAGQDRECAHSVFKKLWVVITDEKFTVDARAWALNSLHFCNVIMDKQLWDTTFNKGKDDTNNGNASDYWIESVTEAKVRARSIQAIGEMAQYSQRRLCWNNMRGSDCEKGLHHCRLSDDRFDIVEKMLVTHWSREIDYSVTERLVQALGFVAGWGKSIRPNRWQVIDILESAADHPDARTNRCVPKAVRRIAINLIHRQDISQKQRNDAIKQLKRLAIKNIKKIERKGVLDRYSQMYDLQRQYVLAMRKVAFIALKDLPENQFEEILRTIAEGLFEIADCEEFENNDVLRRLALYFLNELDDNTGAIRELTKIKYMMMIADPKEAIAKIAAGNMVTTFKDEKEAANFFAEIILEDKSKILDDAIQYRKEKWEARKTDQGFPDADILKKGIRKYLAEVLGNINNNGEAHDNLVKTLQSDALHSGRARDALIVMGGERAVASIINYNLQQQVNDKFFKPMEDAREKGWELLEDVRKKSNINQNIALVAAIVTMLFGIVIFLIGIEIYRESPSPESTAMLLGGPLISFVSFAGSIGAYIWKPARALNKVSSELSRLIMSFENYLGRMRLIGLGFAHAYTQNNFDQLRFLNGVSEITANAMRESALAMEAVGEWPKFETENQFTAVPTLLNLTIIEARRLSEELKLKIEIGEPVYHENTAPDTIIAQTPEPGLFMAKDTIISVTPSTDKLPIVEVPNFADLPIIDAVMGAQQNGLTIESIILQLDEKIKEGTVLSQDLRTGLKVIKGTGIKLTIAKNNNEDVAGEEM